MYRPRIMVFATVTVLLTVIAAEAQVTTGSMLGTVRDDSGGVLPGATASIASPALIGGAREAVTSNNGLFRFPNLSPGISPGFAVATAAGDLLTAALALLAFIGLCRGWGIARRLTWAYTVVGLADLLVALPHAAHTGAVAHLAAQWYVPVLAGPLMVVAHGACLTTLLRSRRVEASKSHP